MLSQMDTRFSSLHFSSARGNTSLESAVTLTKSLRREIQALGQWLATAANAEENIRRGHSKARDKAQHTRELQDIVLAIRKLLTRIEDAVPLINLAITASGASLSSSLPSTVSPSRLLQASTFLTAGDSQYSASLSKSAQIGPTFTLSMYMLFQGHLRPQNEDDIRQSTWKEVIHKANVKIMRVPVDALYALPDVEQRHDLAGNTNTQSSDNSSGGTENGPEYFPPQMSAEVRADEFAYQLVIVEDLEDDRVHTFENDEPQPGIYGDVALAGLREAVPIHELSKIFYADTGKILNIGSEGEANSPVLLLKRDPNAVPPRRMMYQYGKDESPEHEDDCANGQLRSPDPKARKTALTRPPNHNRSSSIAVGSLNHRVDHAPDPWCLPQDLDPEWIAFEVYNETEDSDTESEVEAPSIKPSRSSRTPSLEPSTVSALSRLNINTPTASPSSHAATPICPTLYPQQQLRPTLPPIRTSLSLLEMLLRLLSLQQFQQTPHLSIPDELLTFFLSESASTGAASNDVQERKRLREDARRRVGFDPYDESPVKRRGEEYQYNGGTSSERWDGEGADNGDDEYRSPGRYESSRYNDEGYDTKDWTDGVASKETTPQTPPLSSKNGSKSGTPRSESASSRGRPPPVTRWSSGRRQGLRSGAADGRRGSPLARPGTGLTDEGLRTSPPSAGEGETKP